MGDHPTYCTSHPAQFAKVAIFFLSNSLWNVSPLKQVVRRHFVLFNMSFAIAIRNKSVFLVEDFMNNIWVIPEALLGLAGRFQRQCLRDSPEARTLGCRVCPLFWYLYDSAPDIEGNWSSLHHTSLSTPVIVKTLVPTLLYNSRITDHILHFYGAVILVAHIIVDFVRVIWYVSDLFDLWCDSPIKPIS